MKKEPRSRGPFSFLGALKPHPYSVALLRNLSVVAAAANQNDYKDYPQDTVVIA